MSSVGRVKRLENRKKGGGSPEGGRVRAVEGVGVVGQGGGEGAVTRGLYQEPSVTEQRPHHGVQETCGRVGSGG